MSQTRPVYKGREFYYDKEKTKEGYRYIRNQPLGSKPLKLSVERFRIHQTEEEEEYQHSKRKCDECIGVL